ncbi:hypothetical protein GCL04_09635 [Klebsiella pneumoniae]|nr:hypothetical protein GCL04_09635 [Klebsiella pneumoniae]
MPVLSHCLSARKLAADNDSTQVIQAFASRITEVKKHNYRNRFFQVNCVRKCFTYTKQTGVCLE